MKKYLMYIVLLLLILICIAGFAIYTMAAGSSTADPSVTLEPEQTLSAAATPAAIPAATPAATPYDYINEDGDTITSRFNPPPGFSRKEADGYGEFLRSQKLLPDGSPVLLYNGQPSDRQDKHAAVLAIDVGDKDLQQCADAALRLRCEYKFSKGDYEGIDYHLTNGFEFPYAKYREGYRLEVKGNDTRLVKTEQPDESYETFRKYLNVLFNYASTRSLFAESQAIPLNTVEIGDLFLITGNPGHCVIMMDMCENEKGEKAVLLGQSSMPAQQINILLLAGRYATVGLPERHSFPIADQRLEVFRGKRQAYAVERDMLLGTHKTTAHIFCKIWAVVYCIKAVGAKPSPSEL